MIKKRHRIQARLMRVIMITCGISLLVTCTAFLIYEYLTTRKVERDELFTTGSITAANLSSSLAFDQKTDADEVLSHLASDKSVVAAIVYDNDGKIFSNYPPNFFLSGIDTSFHDHVFRNGLLEMKIPVLQEGERLGTMYVRSNLTNLRERLILYYVIAVVFFVLAFLFAYIVSNKLQKSITSPILDLAGTADYVSRKKDYAIRAQVMSSDETSILTNAFNHMLEQIEKQNTEILRLNHNLEEKVRTRTTQLESLNNELQDQNEFIQTIIDSSVDLIAVFDKERRYIMLNKRADTIYKVGRNNMLGKRLLEVFPSLKNTPMFDNLEKAFSGEFIHHDVYKSMVSDRYFENFFIPMYDDGGEVERVLVIGHDITSIMKANQELKTLNASLEKSNRDLEQFAYVASHDLQEPLRKIQTFSELSENNIGKPEIQKRYLQKISSSARRMTDLIRAVLNYSRLSAEEVVSEIDLNIVINEIITDLELMIADKNVIINKTNLPVVRGIPLQINQLFQNLLTNAIKFSRENPMISITYKQTSEIPDRNIIANAQFHEITVSDNGIGFDEIYKDRIFSIFQRLHNSNAYEGTGIGLALCKKIIENHRGFITVNSKLNEGSSFRVYLPV